MKDLHKQNVLFPVIKSKIGHNRLDYFSLNMVNNQTHVSIWYCSVLENYISCMNVINTD